MQNPTSNASNAHQTPRQIEAGLERDRKVLNSTIQSLRNRFSGDALWADGMALVTENAASYTNVIDRSIRANPLAVALTAVGVAWLILGRKSPSGTEKPALAGTKVEAMSRWEDEGGPVSDPIDPDDHWIETANGLRKRADQMFSQIGAASRNRLAPAADLARSHADVLASLTADIRTAMSSGLEGLSDTAREAAIKARESAYEMRLNAGRYSAEVIRERPIMTAAALAAAGAAIAMLLPRSQMEDRVFGEPRDQIMNDFRQAFYEERSRLSNSIQDTMKSILKDPART